MIKTASTTWTSCRDIKRDVDYGMMQNALKVHLVHNVNGFPI